METSTDEIGDRYPGRPQPLAKATRVTANTTSFGLLGSNLGLSKVKVYYSW